jgi:cell shape-determining protein MreC
MELKEKFSKRVHQAAQELTSLKIEKKQLTSEIELLRQQVKEYQHILRENENLKKDQERLRFRLVKMKKKLEQLFSMETPIIPEMKEEETHATYSK